MTIIVVTSVTTTKPLLSPLLEIYSHAIRENFKSLNQNHKAIPVVKADGYGFGIEHIVSILKKENVHSFFVATPDEAKTIHALFKDAIVYDLSGLSVFLPDSQAIPVINSIEQYKNLSSDREFVLQLDTGMTRLGVDKKDIFEIKHKPRFVMSHLASSDEPNSSQNQEQLKQFIEITENIDAPKSLSATGGILLGKDFEFDITRPGIGIYGGEPFLDALPCCQITLPIIQKRFVKKGTKIGYGGSHIANNDMIVATLLGGYAEGIFRKLSNKALMFYDDIACPILGRVSMDAITADISNAPSADRLTLLGKSRDGIKQDINSLAKIAETIPYELFTSLGKRYKRIVI